jgi:hypothetical protein
MYEIALVREAFRCTFPEFSVRRYLDDGLAFVVATAVAAWLGYFEGGMEAVNAALVGVAAGVLGTVAYVSLKFCALLMSAPYRLYRSERLRRKAKEKELATIKSRPPLELMFEPKDPQAVLDLRDEHGGQSRHFFVKIRNSGDKSISNVVVYALPGLATATFVGMSMADPYHAAIQLDEFDELHPEEEAWVRLFKIAEGSRGYDEVVGSSMVIEAVGRDVRPARLRLSFTGGDTPENRSLIVV